MDDLTPLPSKPQCEDALHELYDLLSGEITDQKRSAIIQHLDECGPCAEPYDFYADLRRCLQQQCRDTAPPELLARIQSAIHQEH